MERKEIMCWPLLLLNKKYLIYASNFSSLPKDIFLCWIFKEWLNCRRNKGWFEVGTLDQRQHCNRVLWVMFACSPRALLRRAWSVLTAALGSASRRLLSVRRRTVTVTYQLHCQPLRLGTHRVRKQCTH